MRVYRYMYTKKNKDKAGKIAGIDIPETRRIFCSDDSTKENLIKEAHRKIYYHVQCIGQCNELLEFLRAKQ